MFRNVPGCSMLRVLSTPVWFMFTGTKPMLIWNANTNKGYCICVIQDSSKLKRCLIRSNKIHIPWNSVSFIWLYLLSKIKSATSWVTLHVEQQNDHVMIRTPLVQKQLITWPKMRKEETGNPAATLSPVKISTILESNQPTSFLFCFKNCFSVSAEGLKRPTCYYRMCSLSPYGINKEKLLPWKTLNGKISVDKSRGSTRRFFDLFSGNIVKDKTQK